MTKTKVLLAVILVEALLIQWLFWRSFRVDIKPTITPISGNANPLETALRFESSEAKFEELVKAHPYWISFRPKERDSFNHSILESCAISRKTNYIRILIAHGADVEVAIKMLSRPPVFEDAIKLLRQVQTEQRPRSESE